MTKALEPTAAFAVHETIAVVTSAMIIGAAALLVLGVQPILLGGLAENGRLSEAEVGRAAMVEILGFAVGSSVGPFWMNSGHMRWKVGTACLLLAVANLAIYRAESTGSIFFQRSVAGIFEGLLIGAVYVVLTHHRRPERMSGIFLGLSTVPQVAAAYLFPAAVIPSYGVEGGFGVLALCAIVGAVCAPALVDRVQIVASSTRGRVVWSPGLVTFVAASFLQSAGIGGAWSYVEQLAAERRFSPEIVGIALSASLAFQVIGALGAAAYSRRISARLALIVGAFAQAAIVTLMSMTRSPEIYVVAASSFGLFWMALQPFGVTVVIGLDPSRKVAMLSTPIVLMGMSAGSFAVSFLASADDVSASFLGGAVLLVLSGMLYLASAWLGSRRRASGRLASGWCTQGQEMMLRNRPYEKIEDYAADAEIEGSQTATRV